MAHPVPRRALLLTAYDRPHYLAEVLASWRAVRGLRDWHVRFALEPSDRLPVVEALAGDLLRTAGLQDAVVLVNERRLGVAENPYRHLGALFDEGFDFVVRAEDDLVVSDDVLEFFDHVAVRYRDDPAVATAHAFTEASGPADAVVRVPEFCPWVWGTWRDRWQRVLGPTWDRDYSTWNSSPGFESGWDWNLNTRVLPSRGLGAVAPLASRVDNIGEVGVHGRPELLVRAPSFEPTRAPVDYRDGTVQSGG